MSPATRLRSVDSPTAHGSYALGAVPLSGITADIVAAALARYPASLSLPELTVTSPDGALIAHLDHGGTPLSYVQDQIRQCYAEARSRYGAPVGMLTDEEAQFWAAVTSYHQRMPAIGNRTTAGYAATVGLLRMSLEALAAIIGFRDRWDSLRDDERLAEAQRLTAAWQGRQRVAAASISTPANPPSLREFVGRLALRGIIVSPTGDGGLYVANASEMTAQEKAMLTTNKAAIVEALGGTRI